MTDQNTDKTYTREDIKAFLEEISARIADKSVPIFHTELALNSLLRLPNAVSLFDAELIKHAKEIWLNIKASGVQLVDPPLLFGETAEVGALLSLEEYGNDGEEDSEDELVDGRLPLQSTQAAS